MLYNYSELFITINRAIADAIIIVVSKIYDKNSTGTNISSVLDKIKIGIIEDADNTEVIDKYIQKQQGTLEEREIKGLKYNLKKWRDKFYAHTDWEFLNNEINLRREYKIDIEEFSKLINFAKNTSSYLYRLINNESMGSSLKFKCEREFDLLIKMLEEHKQTYNNLYDEISSG